MRPKSRFGIAKKRKSGVKLIKGGITAPKGFVASGIHCGIKFWHKDLALIYSKRPCVACGVFTQNKVKAAPLKITQNHLKNNQAQAIVVNSGNANCCTGKEGLSDAIKMCQLAGQKLGINARDVLVASTGVIGRRLPLEKIEKKIDLLVHTLSRSGSLACAEAIMTTDTKPKEISVQIKAGKSEIKIGAVAKGAGMIHPHLATMLSLITTDAVIDKGRLKKALQEAVDNSFNLITVDGDTSTNDMVLALANGCAKNKTFSLKEFSLFQKALNFVGLALAKMIVQDAEGATKFVEVKVEGAKNTAQAKKVAFKVANSPLVKTAIFGENPNWGRIAAAAGIADQAIRADRLSIYLGPIKVLHKGAAVKTEQQRLNQVFKKKEVKIKIGLGQGRAETCVFTCDLSDKYVKINAEY